MGLRPAQPLTLIVQAGRCGLEYRLYQHAQPVGKPAALGGLNRPGFLGGSNI